MSDKWKAVNLSFSVLLSARLSLFEWDRITYLTLILRRLVKYILTHCHPFRRFLLNPYVPPLHKTICMFTSTTLKDSPQHMSVCVTSFEVRMAIQISKHEEKLDELWLQSNPSLTPADEVATHIMISSFRLIYWNPPISILSLDIESFATKIT